MATLTSNIPLQVNKKVFDAVATGSMMYREVGAEIFKIETPDRMTELVSLNQGLSLLTAVPENAPYPQTDVNEYGSVSVAQQMYRQALVFSQLAMGFDKNYSGLAKEITRGGLRLKQTRDNIMASNVRGWNTTTTTWDGLSVVNSAHKIGTTGVTQSNVVTGGLSEANLTTAIQSLFEQRDASNVVNSLFPSILLVPPALDKTAKKILHSEGSPSTANRYTNPLETELPIQDGGDVRIVPWNLLGAVNGGGSDTNCYLLSPQLFTELFYFEQIAPKVTPVLPAWNTNGSFEYRFELSGGAVAAHYQGIVGITA